MIQIVNHRASSSQALLVDSYTSDESAVDFYKCSLGAGG